MASDCIFSLDAIKPQESYVADSIIFVTGNEVPGFMNISFLR